ncbi:MAG TPA: phytoene/squalene synthase family protein [Thermoanaerobaculia bacterium]|jgi:phytoene synthase
MTAVDEAYAFCRKIAHRYGANFSVGFRFLPRAKRRAVYAAYAFCRWADDIADEDVECDGRAAALDAWETELTRCYAGQPTHPITVALADALQHFAIPKSAFVALIDGCRQDVVKHRYETFDELLHYCELVATSISDISLAIFGHRTDAAIGYGRNLATALQLTNVTRDVGDDLARDRVYIPSEELRTFGVSEAELVARTESDRLRRLIEFQIDRAESYFRAAEPLLGELSADARFPVILMGGVYATVLARLRRDPLAVLQYRMSLSRVQKIIVVLRRIFRPHFV